MVKDFLNISFVGIQRGEVYLHVLHHVFKMVLANASVKSPLSLRASTSVFSRDAVDRCTQVHTGNDVLSLPGFGVTRARATARTCIS